MSIVGVGHEKVKEKQNNAKKDTNIFLVLSMTMGVRVQGYSVDGVSKKIAAP